MPAPILPTPSTLAAELGHNTSANAAYNQANFAANFGTSSWANNTGSVLLTVDPAKMDLSLNPVTPCHVSPVSIKTMFPGKTCIAHATNWFHAGGGGGHINNGTNCDSTAWVNAMTADWQARGFDGLNLDWKYSNYLDTVALLVKARVATMVGFTYSIMIDPGSYTDTATLETQLAYIQATYFGTTNYQKIGGKPVLLFFNTVGGVDYAAAKASMGSNTGYWIMQGPGQLGNAWADGVFDWVQPYATSTGTFPTGTGAFSADPYNATAANSFLTTVHSSAKGCVPAVAPGFNGMLTASTAWSKGKYMPRDSGKCWLAQAAVVNANLPTNCPFILFPTVNDWEEGTAMETGIDNAIVVAASVATNTLSWSVAGGTGDETTIDSYRIIASPDGVAAYLVGTAAVGGGNSFNLTTFVSWGAGAWQIYVIAVGKPCVRNQWNAAPVSYTAPVAPPPTPLPTTIKGTFTITIAANSQLIPLDAAPNQTWQVALQIDGAVKIMQAALNYNSVAGYWALTLQDAQGNLLLASKPLLTGLDLFKQFAYLGLGTAAVLNVSNTAADSPNSSNLGSDFQLLWGDTVAA